ncbi:harpin-induced like protein 7 [Carex littledalei]|uniref:Harpin-induced like protein 7 n=1 Tax=Carex littledalei TaxID=544730 RepID=A0A833RI23_9POAL|nr:harpin-induced like protein 7 [Carex littledalei]
MEYQKVYPEASSSAPVAPENLASKSTKDPQIDTLPLYTSPDSEPLPPPTNPRRKRSRWCKCLCWTLISIIIFIVVIAATVGILYLVFRPKIPHYSVDYLSVNTLSLDNNLTANASFDITVTARNPNKRIGIYYLDGSDITAWYNTTQLCNGTFPVFYQGHRNTTVVHLLLSGQPQLTNELVSDIQSQLESGSIPIIVKGRVPVKVKFGALKLFKMTGKVNCKLMLDISSSSGSSSNTQFKFRSSSCSFKLKL